MHFIITGIDSQLEFGHDTSKSSRCMEDSVEPGYVKKEGIPANHPRVSNNVLVIWDILVYLKPSKSKIL
jgi:hypothetical protein